MSYSKQSETPRLEVVPRDTLSMQPEPLTMVVARMDTAAGCVTSILREWAPGDPGRCQLCPAGECGATARGSCLVVATGWVSRESAWLFARPGSRAARAGADQLGDPGHGRGKLFG